MVNRVANMTSAGKSQSYRRTAAVPADQYLHKLQKMSRIVLQVDQFRNSIDFAYRHDGLDISLMLKMFHKISSGVGKITSRKVIVFTFLLDNSSLQVKMETAKATSLLALLGLGLGLGLGSLLVYKLYYRLFVSGGDKTKRKSSDSSNSTETRQNQPSDQEPHDTGESNMGNNASVDPAADLAYFDNTQGKVKFPRHYYNNSDYDLVQHTTEDTSSDDSVSIPFNAVLLSADKDTDSSYGSYEMVQTKDAEGDHAEGVTTQDQVPNTIHKSKDPLNDILDSGEYDSLSDLIGKVSPH
ncbi:uncharacterized protein LOC106151687 [Lingula anatina]|uniref:Uncharacterized protein LOC106151687 n=1 Tax=Lingula anatina TaxID=7574 RepID=A0A1S3H301_LINAN|nr:uncharacterized protein LOC106151687 [Lingula anatina]|eukprot:XP_013380510.1 uncharacterized protein LOC106151687 [Lingula anatina]